MISTMSIFGPRHKYHLPAEVLCNVISHVVPQGGICISNDSEMHTDFATLDALCKTSRTFRDEVLHRTTGQPLQIYISNGKESRCDFGTKPLLETQLGKVFALPPWTFEQIDVIFAPDLYGRHCSRDGSHDEALTDEVLTIRLKSAMLCIKRQSDALAGEFFKFACRVFPSPNFTFQFDGSRGFDQAASGRNLPLWDMKTVKAVLDGWRWRVKPCKTLTQNNPEWDTRCCVKFPEKVLTGIIRDESYGSLWIRDEDGPLNTFDLIRRTWKLDWYDFWWRENLFSESNPYVKGEHNVRFILTIEEDLEADDGTYSYRAERVVT